MEAPTETEISLIKQLRQRVSDLELHERYQSDMFFVRWIRARDQNLNQAEAMLRKSMEWRKSFGMDTLDWTPPELLLTELAIEFLGYSNNNCPTFFIAFGCCDFKRICDLGLNKDCLRYVLRVFERAIDMSKGSGLNGQSSKGQVIVFGDFKDFSVAGVLYPSVAEMTFHVAKYFEANFPETLFKCFFYNAGRGLQIAMNIIRPIVAQKTLSKIEIYTETAYELLPKIHDLLSEDQLPSALGGSAFDVQERLVAKYQAYGAYRRKTVSSIQAALEAGTATVAAGHQLFLEIPVKIAGSKLKYSASVEKHDIDFRIFRGIKEFVAKRRIGSKSADPESGQFVCDKPGVFIVNFDNSYSNYRSKQVNFKISVVEPEP